MNQRIKQIAIVKNQKNPSQLFYYKEKGYLSALTNAFSRRGIKAMLLMGEFPPEKIYSFCKEINPCAIFDFNRSRSQLPDLEKDILHISWWTDNNNPALQVGSNSDLNYCVLPFEYMGAKQLEKHFYDQLHFGVDPTAFCNVGEELEKLSDFSIAGYISPPFEKIYGDQEIGIDNRSIKIVELIDIFFKNYTKGMENYDRDCMQKVLKDILSEKIGWNSSIKLSEEFLNYFEYTLPRTYDRKKMIDKVLKVSKSLRLFGESTWKEWDNYRTYYKGFLASTQELSWMYQTTRFNLHQGFPFLHPRALECMASGGLLFCMNSNIDYPQSIFRLFSAGDHFISYDLDNLQDVVDEVRRNPHLTKKVSQNALEEIKKNHTWDHRVSKILEDINTYLDGEIKSNETRELDTYVSPQS